MPRIVRTTGTEGTDREIDALWRQLDELSRRLRGGETAKKKDEDVVYTEATIDVQETDGDPFLTVTGIEFDANKFAVEQNGSYARILNLAGGSPANSTPPAIASSSATGTDTDHYALDDHTHEGVHQITPYGSGTPFRGDVTLEGKKGILVEAGTNIETNVYYDVLFPTSATYNVTRQDDVLIVDASDGAKTLNLYQAVLADVGKAWHYIKKNDTTSYIVTINAYSGDGIEGGTSFELRYKGDAVFLICSDVGRWDAFGDIRNMAVVRKNSGSTNYLSRRLNLIEGTNVTIDVVQDVPNNELDITISSTGGDGSVYPYWRMRGQSRPTSSALLDSSYFEPDGANQSGVILTWKQSCSSQSGGFGLAEGAIGMLFWGRMNIVNGSSSNQTVTVSIPGHDDSFVVLNQGPDNGAGTISVNTTTKTITGTGTSFTTDFVVGDYIVISTFILRITAVSSATSMTYANNPSETWSPSPGMNYKIAKKVYSASGLATTVNGTYNMTIGGNKTHTIHVLGNSDGGPGCWFAWMNPFDNTNLTWQDAGSG